MTYFQEQLDRLLAEREDDLRTIIINAEGIASLDSSALYGLRQLITTQAALGRTVRFAGLIGPARDALKRAGLYEVVGRENFFLDVVQAIGADPLPAAYALQSNVD